MVEERIEEVLGKFTFSEKARQRMAEARRQQILRDLLDPAAPEISEDVGRVEEGDEVVGEESLSDEGVAAAEGEQEQDAETRPAAELHASMTRDLETEPVDEQTSIIAGGDHFSGEDPLELGDTESAEPVPDEDTVDISATSEPEASNSFADWRAKQVRGENQGSKEYDLDTTLVHSTTDVAVEETSVEDISSDSSAELSPTTEAGEAATAQEAPSTPPESNQQENSPVPSEQPFPATPTRKPSETQFGGGLPPKQLSHLEVNTANATEMERNAVSRP
jgi:hypothetical protein